MEGKKEFLSLSLGYLHLFFTLAYLTRHGSLFVRLYKGISHAFIKVWDFNVINQEIPPRVPVLAVPRS